MSDTAQGGDLDVNSDVGFNAALAAQTGGTLTDEAREALGQGESSVQQGLEVIEESPGERNRDPETGRFLPKEEQSGEGAPPPPAEGAPPVDEGGEQQHEQPAAPEVDWEERYKNLEKVLGDQGQKLGEKIANLEGQLQAAQGQRPPAQFPTVNEETEDQILGMIDTQGGPGTMQWILENRPELFQSALSVWQEEAPGEAAMWAGWYGASLAQQEKTGEQLSEDRPYLQRLETREMIQETVAEATKSLSVEDKKLIAPHFQVAADEAPDFVKKAYVSEDPKERLQAAQWILGQARVKAVEHATAQARETRQQETEAAKGAAMVATGSLRPVVGGHSGAEQPNLEGMSPTERTAAITKLFHEELMKTETTSVYDGLSTG